MFERFTDRARKVMALANQEAHRFNHEYIGTEHILLGLVKEGSGVGANVLKGMGLDLANVRLEVEKLVKGGEESTGTGKLPQTPRAKKVIEYAIVEARNLNHNYVGTEHLLLGLLREEDGVAAQVLMNLGAKLEEVRNEVLKILGAGVETEQGQAQASTTAEAEPIGDDLRQRFADHSLVKQYNALIAEHRRWQAEAVTKAEYEKAAVWRDLATALEKTLERLYRELEKDPSLGS